MTRKSALPDKVTLSQDLRTSLYKIGQRLPKSDVILYGTHSDASDKPRIILNFLHNGRDCYATLTITRIAHDLPRDA